MRTHTSVPSAQDLQEIGRQTLVSLEERRRLLMFWRDLSKTMRVAVTRYVQAVYETDPSGFNREQYALADESLNLLIAAIETYLAQHVDCHDISTCQFLGESICQLREAREWIAQGLSPSPPKRPSDAELQKLSDQCAMDVLAAIVPSK